VKGIYDIITRAKFGDDRFRGSGVVAGEISAFPIDFAGRPYNTLTLPCESVICVKVHYFRLCRKSGRQNATEHMAVMSKDYSHQRL